jgi:hypothetical protein
VKENVEKKRKKRNHANKNSTVVVVGAKHLQHLNKPPTNKIGFKQDRILQELPPETLLAILPETVGNDGRVSGVTPSVAADVPAQEPQDIPPNHF